MPLAPLALGAALSASLAGAAVPGAAARCALGFPADCRALGRAALAGAGAPRDDRLASAYLTIACEMADPAACGDLGALHAVGRGVVQSDERAVALSRRACEQGTALACSNLGALLLEGAGPAARGRAEAGSEPARLFRKACDAGIAEGCANLAAGRTGGPRVLAIPGAGAFAPGELAARGAAGHPRRAAADVRAAPATATPSDEAVAILLAFRRGQLAQCAEVPRADPRPAEVRATFLLDGDGRAAEIHPASDPPDAGLDECARALVEGWEFPASAEGFSGPFLVRHTLEAAPPVAASYAGPGFLRPALRDPGCVERALRVPAELRGAAGSVTVKLAVDVAGRPGLVHAVSPAPEGLVSAVAAAVVACPWRAGGDAEGRPLPLWTTLTVRIAPR